MTKEKMLLNQFVQPRIRLMPMHPRRDQSSAVVLLGCVVGIANTRAVTACAVDSIETLQTAGNGNYTHALYAATEDDVRDAIVAVCG